MKRSAAETRGSGSMPRMGCERSNAARVRREDGRGDRPVAANLRVVRGLLVLADSPPPGRRRAHAVVPEAAGLRPHPCTRARATRPCLIISSHAGMAANTIIRWRLGSSPAGGSDLTPHAGFPAGCRQPPSPWRPQGLREYGSVRLGSGCGSRSRAKALSVL